MSDPKKPACCEVATDREAFLQQKLKNFKAYVEPFCSPEGKAQLHLLSGSLDDLMPFVLKAKACALSLGQEALDKQIDALCETMTKGTVTPAFREKVGRYVAMFCELM